jgi:thiamine pyrophosphate-dependent acetolactate synthase large subunit-like protein
MAQVAGALNLAVGLRVEEAGDIAPAPDRACKAERPAIIDVVTEIEILAPMAVSA